MITPWKFMSGKSGVQWILTPILLLAGLVLHVPAQAGSGPPAFQEIVTLVVDAPQVTSFIDTPDDVDWFCFTISTPGSYQIRTVTGTLTSNTVNLYGPDSSSTLRRTVYGSTGEAFLPMVTLIEPLEPGTYYLRIAALYGEMGSYAIRIISLPFTPRTLIVDGAAVSNNTNAISGEDWYRFSVSTAGMYCIQTRASSVRENTVILYGPDSLAMQLGEDSRSGTGPLGGLTRQLNPGTYYVRVIRPWNNTETGIYMIRVTTAAPPVALPLDNTPVAADIAAPWEIDWFTFTLTSTQTVEITTTPGILRHDYLTLYGPDTRERVMAQDECSGLYGMAQITRMLSPGTYYARVEGFFAGSAGSYAIRASTTPVDVIPLDIDAPPTLATLIPGYGWNWFRFTVVNPGIYAIDTRADTLVSNYFLLYNADDLSTPLDLSPYGGIDGMASGTISLTQGTYYFQVSGYGAIGQYWVRVTQVDPTPISINQAAITGNIANPCDLDWYTFTVTKIETITVLTTAGTLTDSYLLLYELDNTGRVVPVIYDDDNGPGLMAQLIRRLLPGVYYLRLQAKEANRTGTYSLRVASGDALIPTLTVGGAVRAGMIVPEVGENWYKFTITTTGIYTIDTRLITMGQNRLELYGPNDIMLSMGGNVIGSIGSAASLTRRLWPGTYYVSVTCGGWYVNGGSYNICLVDSTPVTNLTVDGPAVTGNIARPGDINWYRFTLASDQSVVITTTPGTLLNSYLLLSRPGDRFSPYLKDDNSGPGYMAQISCTLGPGTYYARVVGHFAGNTGTYGIQVKIQ